MKKYIKSCARQLLKCGVNRLKFNIKSTQDIKKIDQARGKSAIRELIKQNIITRRPIKGVSRARAKIILKQKQKGLRSGRGSRKGSRKSCEKRTKVYINRVRANRDELMKFYKSGELTAAEHKYHYNLSNTIAYSSRSKTRRNIYSYKKNKSMTSSPQKLEDFNNVKKQNS